MSRYTVDDFVTRTEQTDKGEGLFELEGDRILEVNLAPRGMVWTKTGSMIFYQGLVKFTREAVFEHGFSRFIKKSLTG